MRRRNNKAAASSTASVAAAAASAAVASATSSSSLPHPMESEEICEVLPAEIRTPTSSVVSSVADPPPQVP